MPTAIFSDEVRRLVAEGAQLVEELPREEYEDEHLLGAINIPLKRHALILIDGVYTSPRVINGHFRWSAAFTRQRSLALHKKSLGSSTS